MGLVFFAIGGLLFNLVLIGLIVHEFDLTRWMYHDLKQNSHAYGREIDPATIASLSDRHGLWISFGAFGIASAFGVALALNLLTAASLLERKPGLARQRLRWYLRYKPLGIFLTVVTSFWCGHASLNYLILATRHTPLEADPFNITTIAWIVCALLPWWLVKKLLTETSE